MTSQGASSGDHFQDVDLSTQLHCELCQTTQPNEILLPACRCIECAETFVHPACISSYASVARRNCVNDCPCVTDGTESTPSSRPGSFTQSDDSSKTVPPQKLRTATSQPSLSNDKSTPKMTSRHRTASQNSRNKPLIINQTSILDLHTAKPTRTAVDANALKAPSSAPSTPRIHASYTSKGGIKPTLVRKPQGNRSRSTSPHGSPSTVRKLKAVKSLGTMQLRIDSFASDIVESTIRSSSFSNLGTIHDANTSSRQLLFRRSHQRRSSYGERIQTEEEDEIFQDKDLLVMTRSHSSQPSSPVHGHTLLKSGGSRSLANLPLHLAQGDSDGNLSDSGTVTPRGRSITPNPKRNSSNNEGSLQLTILREESIEGAINTAPRQRPSGRRRRISASWGPKMLEALTLNELQMEVHIRQMELERQSNVLVSLLQEQDILRKDADALQIRAHLLCVETLQRTQDAHRLTKTGTR